MKYVLTVCAVDSSSNKNIFGHHLSQIGNPQGISNFPPMKDFQFRNSNLINFQTPRHPSPLPTCLTDVLNVFSCLAEQRVAGRTDIVLLLSAHHFLSLNTPRQVQADSLVTHLKQ